MSSMSAEVKYGQFVIAVHLEHNCYKMLRIIEASTGEIEDIDNITLMQQMTAGINPRVLENMDFDYRKGTFRWTQGGEGHICYLDANGNPTVNKDSVTVLAITGDYVTICNYKGQVVQVHMMQLANNVRNRKAVLNNATVTPGGRIRIKEVKQTPYWLSSGKLYY